jgi:phthalate 4,5-dioxygenase
VRHAASWETARPPSTFPGETYHGFTVVPIHDTACWVYCYSWNPDRPLAEEQRAKLDAGFGLTCDRDERYMPVRNVHNDFQIDREDQRHRTYTGVQGLAEQDAMIQHSQGPIADRTREILNTTDAAVVRFRSLVLKEAAALAEGVEPVAPTCHEAFRARPGSWLADQGVPIEEIMLARFDDPLGRVGGTAAAE